MAIMKFNMRAGLLGLVVATAALSSQKRDAMDVHFGEALSLRSLMNAPTATNIYAMQSPLPSPMPVRRSLPSYLPAEWEWSPLSSRNFASARRNIRSFASARPSMSTPGSPYWHMDSTTTDSDSSRTSMAMQSPIWLRWPSLQTNGNVSRSPGAGARLVEDYSELEEHEQLQWALEESRKMWELTTRADSRHARSQEDIIWKEEREMWLAIEASIKSEADRLEKRRDEFAKRWAQVVSPIDQFDIISDDEAARVEDVRALAEELYVNASGDMALEAEKVANDMLEEEAIKKINRAEAKAKSDEVSQSWSLMASALAARRASGSAQEQQDGRSSWTWYWATHPNFSDTELEYGRPSPIYRRSEGVRTMGYGTQSNTDSDSSDLGYVTAPSEDEGELSDLDEFTSPPTFLSLVDATRPWDEEEDECLVA